MTTQGSARSRFRRVLASGDEQTVLAAAREVPSLTAAEAFAVLLVLADAGSARYSQAAARFLARIGRELRPDLDDGLTLAATLRVLGADRDDAGRETSGLLAARVLAGLGLGAAEREAQAWRQARLRRRAAEQWPRSSAVT